MEKVSLLMLTIDRYEQTRNTLEANLIRSGYPYDLYIADNGSQDTRVIDWIRSLGPAVHLVSRENQGVARAFNSLLKLARGPYYCLLGNDILLPENWLADLVTAYQEVPLAGLAGIHCVEMPGVPTEVHPGLKIDLVEKVFGVTLFDHHVFKAVGYFNEAFNPYGLEDSDYNLRVNRLGFQSFYLHGAKSDHQGHDVGQDTAYRKMKDASLVKNSQAWPLITGQYLETGRWYIPADGEFIINQPQYPGE